MEIENPFKETRKESIGEAQQRLADLAKMGLWFAGIEFTRKEQEALAIVLGAVMRKYPNLKDIDFLKIIEAIK